MTRKLTLPLAAPGAAPPAPTIDVVRKRLGGRGSTDAGSGEVVLVGRAVGVVLFVRGEELDVWFEGDIVRRLRRGEARPPDVVVPSPLQAVARDARVFSTLVEGQQVSFERGGAMYDGVLVEKCRFGALVELPSGTVAGVAFRRLLPRLGSGPVPFGAG
jgi:hypothetical protein